MSNPTATKCECDLRDRLWNPFSKKCERCHKRFDDPFTVSASSTHSVAVRQMPGIKTQAVDSPDKDGQISASPVPADPATKCANCGLAESNHLTERLWCPIADVEAGADWFTPVPADPATCAHLHIGIDGVCQDCGAMIEAYSPVPADSADARTKKYPFLRDNPMCQCGAVFGDHRFSNNACPDGSGFIFAERDASPESVTEPVADRADEATTNSEIADLVQRIFNSHNDGRECFCPICNGLSKIREKHPESVTKPVADSAPVENSKCWEFCGHSQGEHDAFDRGQAVGEQGSTHLPDHEEYAHPWRVGNSVGILKYEAAIAESEISIGDSGHPISPPLSERPAVELRIKTDSGDIPPDDRLKRVIEQHGRMFGAIAEMPDSAREVTDEMREWFDLLSPGWRTDRILQCPCGAEFDTWKEISVIEHYPHRAPAALTEGEPVDMLLFCPDCGEQHVDESAPDICEDCGYGELAHCADNSCEVFAPCNKFNPWLNPPHKSHRCAYCNHVWRPADVPTNGVTATATKGKNDLSPRPRYSTNGLEPTATPSPVEIEGEVNYSDTLEVWCLGSKNLADFFEENKGKRLKITEIK